jgi:hypothetical protein
MYYENRDVRHSAGRTVDVIFWFQSLNILCDKHTASSAVKYARRLFRRTVKEKFLGYLSLDDVVQVAPDLRPIRITPILKPGGQKVGKIYFTIIYNVLQFYLYCFFY